MKVRKEFEGMHDELQRLQLDNVVIVSYTLGEFRNLCLQEEVWKILRRFINSLRLFGGRIDDLCAFFSVVEKFIRHIDEMHVESFA